MKGYSSVFVIFLIIYGVYFVMHQSKPTTEQAPVSDQKVLSAENQNAECHAQDLNPSDPQAVLPDPNCTPGAINSIVTQDNIDSTICASGYTKTIRPPVSYTNRLKHEQIQEYGFLDTNVRDYEEDHFISLELGGSPDDPKNLWPEPHGSPNEKDSVENYLNREVCDHKMSLTEAQKDITSNWYAIYRTISQ
jgi:hypothetical protein